MKTELEDFISENKEAFDNRMPDPAVLERIQQQMRTLNQKKEKTVVISMRVLLRVAACLIVMAGAATYWILQKEEPAKTEARVTAERTPQPKNTEEKTTDILVADNKPNVLASQVSTNKTIDEELASRKMLLFAKLNNMESPSQRLTAATQASQLKNTGNDIVDALVKTMNTDPSTNVRLAALEGLSKFYKESYVKKQLIASLKIQKDPMVQIGLIELLTRMKQTIILDELDKIVKDGNTMDAVKDHAYSSMFTLRS